MLVNSANATLLGVLPEILSGFSSLSHPKPWSVFFPWPFHVSGPLQPCCRLTHTHTFLPALISQPGHLICSLKNILSACTNTAFLFFLIKKMLCKGLPTNSACSQPKPCLLCVSFSSSSKDHSRISPKSSRAFPYIFSWAAFNTLVLRQPWCVHHQSWVLWICLCDADAFV